METIDPTLINPKETTIGARLIKGEKPGGKKEGGKKFLLSKLPATVAREILLAYTGALRGDDISYDKVPLENSIRLLSFASVKVGDAWMRLSTAEIIDAHISNVMDYMELEKEMLGHSMDFS